MKRRMNANTSAVVQIEEELKHLSQRLEAYEDVIAEGGEHIHLVQFQYDYLLILQRTLQVIY
jgi:hypothetical protein